MFPSLVGMIIGGTIIPIKDCSFEGEHPNFSPLSMIYEQVHLIRKERNAKILQKHNPGSGRRVGARSRRRPHSPRPPQRPASV